MELKESIQLLLKQLKNAGLSRAEIAKKIGMAEHGITQSLSRGGSEKLYISLKLLSDNVLNNSTSENEERGTFAEEKKDVAGSAKTTKTSESNSGDMLRILSNLSESHKNLTAAHKEIAQSNNKLSAANHTLAGNEKMLLEKIPTAHVVSDNSTGDASILVPLVDILAGIASGKTRYRSKEEAVAELGMKLSLHKPGKGKLKSIPSDAGK